jgi:predicted DCC family thiol-disulfide oxidoreductase YuxK
MKIFYDGNCPLCVAEMKKLKKYDAQEKITTINLHDDDFSMRFPHIDKSSALTVLHAQDEQGNIWLGLDATYKAWRSVGKYPWLKLIRIVPVRWLADFAYLFFAKHRMGISRLLMPNRCSRNGCKL